MDVLNRLKKAGIVPAAAIENAEDAVPTAKALLAGGIDTIEVTFRTDSAAEAIKQISEQCPEVLVGAGTVLTVDQCKEAVACGAKYIVSPGYSDEVVSWCIENEVAVVPGVQTASEITAAYVKGLRVVKFFPAGPCGGVAAMKALSGPFGDMNFIPTGGVSGDNICEYYSPKFIYAVGGSWLCTRKDIADNNFEKITELSSKAVEAISDIKK